MVIDDKSYELGEGNFYDKQFEKNRIVVGNTNRKNIAILLAK